MSQSVHVFNQFVWLLAMIATLGLILLAWKRPVAKPPIEAVMASAPIVDEPVRAENTLMIMHVRKIHMP